MKLEQSLAQAQQLAPAMRYSLHLLQLGSADLLAELEQAALNNPMLLLDSQPRSPLPSVRICEASRPDISDELVRPKSYTDHLLSQLGQMKQLDRNMLYISQYIVSCLSSTGYLEIPLDEIAQDLGISVFAASQALYVVQDLDPAGTAARSLSECLLLQLASGSSFSAHTVRIVSSGLELLAKNDTARIAKLCRCSLSEAEQAADVIRQLNPVPSNGFYTGEDAVCSVPEAEIICRDDKLSAVFNEHTFPIPLLDPFYLSLLNDAEYSETHSYLRGQLKSANELIDAVNKRRSTVKRLIDLILIKQEAWFLSGAPLAVCTLSDAARELELSISTVSRAVKDKYILYKNRSFPLRSFFKSGVTGAAGEASPDAVQHLIRKLINSEDKASPLSDESIAAHLHDSGIRISRRTVAKYRSAAGIPSAYERKLC